MFKMIKGIKEGSKDKKISGHHEKNTGNLEKILEMLDMKDIANVFLKTP